MPSERSGISFKGIIVDVEASWSGGCYICTPSPGTQRLALGSMQSDARGSCHLSVFAVLDGKAIAPCASRPQASGLMHNVQSEALGGAF